jgi:glyoxylase-like metal-dependent hydrolase (beta-lactamase superfamily II)
MRENRVTGNRFQKIHVYVIEFPIHRIRQQEEATMRPCLRTGLRALVYVALVFGLAGAQQTQQPPPAQPAQYQQQPAPIALEKIAAGIYQVRGGSGANCGMIIGEKEAMVIDAKMSEESAKQMLAEMAKISPVPVRVLAFTHSDGDHVNGITGFPADIKILAQEETKRYMDEAFTDEKQRAYLPQITTFATGGPEYDLGGRKVQLVNFGPAHTSGDAVVYVPEVKVAFLGDLFFAGRDPLIHRHKNGNSFGLVKVLKSVLKLEAEVFLSGHAEKATRADVENLIKLLEEKQAQIRAMIDEGKSLDEVKKFYKVEDRPAAPGRPRFLSLVEVIWLELMPKEITTLPKKK